MDPADSPERQAAMTRDIARMDLQITGLEEDVERLTAERDRLRAALEEIATGRDAKGLISDFPREIAQDALAATPPHKAKPSGLQPPGFRTPTDL
jgi:cell division protein FtsB